MRGPIIAVEGLDGTGKSTTVALLSVALGATVVRNPPASVAGARAVADGLPQQERRAWYLDANRAAMVEARAAAELGARVVLDRSVASTLAFGSAERGMTATLDNLPDKDLLPDAIVLLTLPETHRRLRLRAGRNATTGEEDRLSTDPAFRGRVVDGYRQICSHVVSAAPPPEDVVAAILLQLRALLESRA